MSFGSFLRKADVYPCRYKDMLKDCFSVMKRVLVANPQISASDDKLRRAIQASSFENMQKIEEVRGRPFRTETVRQTATVFVRKGIQGDWKNYFSSADEAFLQNEAGEWMSRLGYN